MSRRDVGAEIIITTLKIQTRWMVKEFGRASCNRRSYQGQKLSMSMAPMLPTPVPQALKIWTATPFCFISLVKVAWWKKLLRICSHHTSVRPKPGFGIGNRNQDQVSVSVSMPKLLLPKRKKMHNWLQIK